MLKAENVISLRMENHPSFSLACYKKHYKACSIFSIPNCLSKLRRSLTEAEMKEQAIKEHHLAVEGHRNLLIMLVWQNLSVILYF